MSEWKCMTFSAANSFDIAERNASARHWKPIGRRYSEVSDGCRRRSAVENEIWAEAMAEVVAHLVTAHSVLGELVPQNPQAPVALGSYDMASQGVSVALVALGECSASASWSDPESSEHRESSLSAASSWRDPFHHAAGLDTPVELSSANSASHARKKPVRVSDR